MSWEQEWQNFVEAMAELLDFMRHSRILIIVENLKFFEIHGEDLKHHLERFKMTNVLVMVLSQEMQPFVMKKIQPYPEYHWIDWRPNSTPQFPPLWLDLYNKTLMSFVEQTSSRSFVYADAKGNFHMNGFVARLILLFAEHYNASLEMLYPLKVGNKTHYTVINQLVADNKLDLPMAMIPAIFEEEWRHVSDTYDINEIMLMVPLSEALTMPEIFGALLDGKFFACYLSLALIFSLIHGLVEFCREHLENSWDFLLHPRIWPGVLGQAFTMAPHPAMSLKLLYLLLGFYGLYMATQFSADINTYFTRPPHHPEINSYKDLLGSPKKILINSADAQEIHDWLDPYRKSMIFTNNTTLVHELRRRLNTSYCYYATTASYQLAWRQQKYSSRQLFHTPKSMAFFSMLPWGFRLQHNSPYKQALNHLIHQVHAAGLVDAWTDSLFWDMLRLKQVSIRDVNPPAERKVLSVCDLFWVWMIVVIGLSGSGVNVYKEESFDSILLVYKRDPYFPEEILKDIYRLNIPTLCLSKDQGKLVAKTNFNRQIVAVLLFSKSLDLGLLQIMANSLDYMRQNRIIVVAVDIPKGGEKEEGEDFRKLLLESCEKYFFTNVLVIFTNKDLDTHEAIHLNPFPNYHWTKQGDPLRPYFQDHWRNMHNKTLLTYMDRAPPKSLYYKDPQGNLKINGFVARFVMLFAERHNAHLEMAFPLSFEEPTHFSLIVESMVRPNLIDIPMVMDTSPFIDKWYNMTNTLHHDKGLVAVPCAQALSKQEVYGILLNEVFFGYVILCTIGLSLVQSLIDYLFNGQLHMSRLLFSELIFPGILGQTFSIGNFSQISAKIIYFMLFLGGLYLNTIFSVNVSTHFTHPPKHRQIETMTDLLNSPLKILLYDLEATVILDHGMAYRPVFITTSNFNHLQELRNNLNISYGYYFSSSAWRMISLKQHFFENKILCTYDNLTLFPNLRWAIPLPHNSPYKEGLNELIELVNAYGLMEAWNADTFSDMLELKEMTISDPYRDSYGPPKALTIGDMFWIWMICLMGLGAAVG
uniref:Uncharacterized protein n=1 Tax=Musca domestica TaxID=7370 RepID=A0A1I8MIG3_MUSDO